MNYLFEISPMKNIKITKKIQDTIQEIFDISYNFDLFTCGIQKKENKIRILCDSQIWHKIQNKLQEKIKYNELKKNRIRDNK